MIPSKKDDKSNVHDFIDYSFSKEVIRDHPRVIKIYETLLPALYKYAQYQGVWPVIQMIEDSKLLMEMQLDHYSDIYNSKGLRKNENPRKK